MINENEVFINDTVTHFNKIASVLQTNPELCQKNEAKIARIFQNAISQATDKGKRPGEPPATKKQEQNPFTDGIHNNCEESAAFFNELVRREGDSLAEKLIKTSEKIGLPNKHNILIYYDVILGVVNKSIFPIMNNFEQKKDSEKNFYYANYKIVNDLVSGLTKEIIGQACNQATLKSTQKEPLTATSLKTSFLNAISIAASKGEGQFSCYKSLQSPDSALLAITSHAVNLTEKKGASGATGSAIQGLLEYNNPLTLDQLKEFQNSVINPSVGNNARALYYNNLNQFCNNLDNYNKTINLNRESQQFYDKGIKIRNNIKNAVATRGGN